MFTEYILPAIEILENIDSREVNAESKRLPRNYTFIGLKLELHLGQNILEIMAITA